MGRLQWGYERFPVCSEKISAPPEAYFKRFYYDTVCRNVPALRMALSMFVVGHIMFGTDIPLREDIELQRRDIEGLGLTAAELDDITPTTRRVSWASRYRAERMSDFRFPQGVSSKKDAL